MHSPWIPFVHSQVYVPATFQPNAALKVVWLFTRQTGKLLSLSPMTLKQMSSLRSWRAPAQRCRCCPSESPGFRPPGLWEWGKVSQHDFSLCIPPCRWAAGLWSSRNSVCCASSTLLLPQQGELQLAISSGLFATQQYLNYWYSNATRGIWELDSFILNALKNRNHSSSRLNY